MIVGGRVDGGSQFASQVSPKLGVVFAPARDQALRVTFNRGYLAPSAFQRFLRFPAGAPQDIAARMLAERVAELLNELPPGEVYRRRLAAPPEARKIEVSLPAPKRSALWREEFALTWHYVYWQPAADAQTPSMSSVRGGLKSKCRGPP